MKLLLNLTSEIEVLCYADKWIEPDWSAAIKELKSWDGVKQATFTMLPQSQTADGWAVYSLTLLVNARKFAGEEMWQMCREQFKEDGEPIIAAAIVESMLSDEGGWDGPLHDAIAPTLPDGVYGLQIDGPPNIEDAS